MKKIDYKIFCCTVCLAALAACGKPYPVYETKIEYVKPPVYLLEPLPVPQFSGASNEDLLFYTLTLEENLCLCNARLEAIKKSVE